MSNDTAHEKVEQQDQLANAIRIADPYRRQGTLYIHTQQRPAVEEGATTTTTKKKVDSPNGTGELVVPISLSTTFRQEIPGQATAVGDFHSWGVGYEYARTGNPTRGALERALAQAEGGANYAVAFSSGSAAVSAVLQSILLLSSPTASAVASSPPQQQQQELHQGGVPLINGEGPPPFGVSDDHQPRRHHLLCIDDVYGGTQRYIRRILVPTHDVEAEFIDMSNPDQNKLPFRDNTRLVWLESPTNPTLKITDIARIAQEIQTENERRCHQYSSSNDNNNNNNHDNAGRIRLIVDNTFCSPYFQNPLLLGADVVVHSATKYIGGHSDVVLGAACTNDGELYQTLRFLQNGVGAVPSPFDCFLTHRGLKTLHLRMEASARNAMAIALFLEQGGHPAVQKVIYPGLISHPQHELAKRQQHGFGSMVSFTCIGGRKEASTFLTTLKVFALAESLGAVESLAESPSLMTHASVPAEQRALLGIDDSLIRLSVGVESCHDLLEDLQQALDAILLSQGHLSHPSSQSQTEPGTTSAHNQ